MVTHQQTCGFPTRKTGQLCLSRQLLCALSHQTLLSTVNQPEEQNSQTRAHNHEDERGAPTPVVNNNADTGRSQGRTQSVTEQAGEARSGTRNMRGGTGQ